MRGSCLLLVVFAACSDDGIYIEVRVPAGMATTEVELYLATSECKDEDGFDCSAIVGPRFTAEPRDPVPGKVFYVDSDERFASTVDGDGSAWFFLPPSTDQLIKTAAAVGRDGENNVGVAILAPIDPRRSPQHVRVDLRFVADDVVRGQSPAVEIWRPQSDRYRCIGADSDGRVVYIVPREDPDCDEVVDTQVQDECDPGEHLAVEAKDLLSCTTPRPLDAACVLGDRPCDETRPDLVAECQPASETICVPDRACACQLGDTGCLASLFEDQNGLGSTQIACVVETIADGGERLTCPDLPVPGEPFGIGVCASPLIAIANDHLDGFATSVTEPTSVGEVTLTPIIADDCQIGLEAPNSRFSNGVPQPIRALVKIDVTPASPETRFVIVPLTVTFTDGTCGVQTGCVVQRAIDERIEKCFLE